MSHEDRARKAIDGMSDRIADLEDKIADLEEELQRVGSGSDLAQAVRAYFDWVQQTTPASKETRKVVLNHHLSVIQEQLQTFQA